MTRIETPKSVTRSASETFRMLLIIVVVLTCSVIATPGVSFSDPGLATLTVTTEETPGPLEGTTVLLENTATFEVVAGQTDSDGIVVFEVEPGNYIVTAKRYCVEQWHPESWEVTLVEGVPTHRYLTGQKSASCDVQHVILIVADGMGWERLMEVAPPNIMRMISEGAETRGISEVPSVTVTNLNTIKTGAHASTHGVVGNRYRLVDTSDSPTSVFSAARSAGLSTALYQPAYPPPFFELDGYYQIINAIMEGALGNLAYWHWTTTDSRGHKYGPDSIEYEKAIIEMDGYIGSIMDLLKMYGMTSNTVLALTADHGSECLAPGCAFPGTDRILDLRYLLEQDEEIEVDAWCGSGARMAHVYLSDPALADAAKDQLAPVLGIERVYTKSELDGADLGDEFYGYLAHPNAGDVVAFAKAGYALGRSRNRTNMKDVELCERKRGGHTMADDALYWDCEPDYRGGHGGFSGREMYVPFVMWGGKIEPSCTMNTHYTADWASTIAYVLDFASPDDSEGTAAVECVSSP